MFVIIISIIISIEAALMAWKAIDHRKSAMAALERGNARAMQLQKQISDLEAQSKAQHEQVSASEAVIARENEQMSIAIRYAEGIQRSLIPSPGKIKNAFPESFVYFAPKNVVSGDFYNMFELKNFTVLVVADCTGHGVPGGFLSMMAMAALREMLPKYWGCSQMPTAEIMGKMRDFVISSLSESIGGAGGSMEVSDGMDMTIAAISSDRRLLTYSLADHNIYLCRDGQAEKLKGDRMPVGRHPNQGLPFVQDSLPLMPGDMLFLCSDGIQDQMGGPDDCKFLTKRLAAMLSENSGKKIAEQARAISKTVNDWKRNYEQVDDQTLIGIRIQ